MDDPFIQDHDASELEIAREFLTNWLPFLTRDLCDRCSQTLADRVRSLRQDSMRSESPNFTEQIEPSGSPSRSHRDSLTPDPVEESPSWSEHIEPSGWGTDPEMEPDRSSGSPKVRMSWADMAQEEDELAEEEEKARETSEEAKYEGKKKVELPREQREWIRFQNVGRKKDFISLERVKGKIVNILDGLELHTGVFSAAEQKRIVDFVYELQEKGRKSEFRDRTYSEPQKWMRGKGRVTIQFGCCYNYATDKDGNPPGILRNVVADPIPSLFKVIIRRLVRWHVLPTSCIPDSCIVNIYEPGDCIPPHIDSHDFVRPFSTVSFLSECDILFGSSLKVEGAGEFSGSTAMSLPMG
ncbi:uncharacterized protein A4U43_C01F14550 [Asparagus officinalis]|uniref:Alpha-ketoglutarate-dependent dioxygenase AlkB-like domain-containing protein n=3 Tax=Asparagus officinalis TaxID=4686 RepID=A0A5P1FPX4_ASPOF|nr:uncharacterized protein A4U43_C01F14550 [Asparagus officinalis]